MREKAPRRSIPYSASAVPGGGRADIHAQTQGLKLIE
jgi:hypothetical protein